MHAAARLPFSPRQIGILIGWGALLWFLAAQICQLAGAMGWFEGGARALLYGAVVMGTIPLIPITKRIAGLADSEVALGLTLVTLTALLLDGIALAWFPALYGGGDAQAAASGAVILWGAGVGLALGCWFNRVPQQ
jgi:hypothetical protein